MAPNTSICAGCVKANDMARVIMYDVLDQVHMANPKLEMSQYVDDALLAKDFWGKRQGYSKSCLCLLAQAVRHCWG